ncbi:hypothetical protein G9C85_03500 [Halorubellus sp. JP-L1]|uniref:hypothetical protein n=1 Tax=Halorubellus sp. JP-L1 TaxID=2715753 RepID=UPI00140D9C89|nr:hypothetical protein [Halorubellus sp. JP-L1]NHN40701.1 hypothetical protein [Halorubellus sp. JP-L1]
MTTFLEFLVGNAFALAAVAALAFVLLALFALGENRPPVVQPTRPVSSADALESTGEPVAVVGTPSCEAPLSTPFTGNDAVAYEVDVGSPFGHVATVRASTAFALDVDGHDVRVAPRDPRAIVIDDERTQHRRIEDDRDDLDATTVDSLTAHDADRSALARLLSGRTLPGLTRRTYRIRTVPLDEAVAVVGVLHRDGDGWTLEPPADGAIRYLDPASVDRTA